MGTAGIAISALRTRGSGSSGLGGLSPFPRHLLHTRHTSHPRQAQGAGAGGGRRKPWARGGISHPRRGSAGVSAPGLRPPALLSSSATPASRREGVTAAVLQRPHLDFTKRVVFPQNTRSFAGITSPSVCRRRDAKEDTHCLHHGTLHSHHDQSNQFVPASGIHRAPLPLGQHFPE